MINSNEDANAFNKAQDDDKASLSAKSKKKKKAVVSLGFFAGLIVIIALLVGGVTFTLGEKRQAVHPIIATSELDPKQQAINSSVVKQKGSFPYHTDHLEKGSDNGSNVATTTDTKKGHRVCDLRSTNARKEKKQSKSSKSKGVTTTGATATITTTLPAK